MNKYSYRAKGALAFLLFSTTALSVATAQDAEPDTVDVTAVETSEDAEQTLDRVVTTGSRIRGLSEDGAVQAFSINRDLIEETGAGSVIEVLKDLPQTGGGRGTFSTSTAGALSGETPAGAASAAAGTSDSSRDRRRSGVAIRPPPPARRWWTAR